jgi:hypothetical protein
MMRSLRGWDSVCCVSEVSLMTLDVERFERPRDCEAEGFLKLSRSEGGV